MSNASSDDPYVEPPNSTVDDWLGQSAERDRELADRLVDEEGGNEEAAERRFAAEAKGADEQRARRDPNQAAGTGADPESPGSTLARDLPPAEPNEPA